MRALEQQTILITGATDGLGRALASELAATGATLLVHGRDETRGAQAIAELEAANANAKLRWLQADLSSLEQVRAVARSVAAQCDRLDVLVNNAGIGTTLPGDGRRMVSQDGYELRFAVNYLAGYLLTRMLLSLLGSLRARAGGQRELRRTITAGLRRCDARAPLQRRPGLLPEQARPDHVHV